MGTVDRCEAVDPKVLYNDMPLESKYRDMAAFDCIDLRCQYSLDFVM